ncbi:hypothetical protein [Oceanimonas smirnovii]|uniref:hypothetical protein n=1 Tax=Oceanimonas smirnovii TaxID=264574 RepID=UPI003FD64A8C
MFFKIGKFLNSLQYHVDKNIDETLYQNKTFLSSKWNFLEYNILRWSQRYVYYIFLIVMLSCLLVTNLLIWKEELTPFVGEYFSHWNKLLDWQSVFLAGQLTIVGVVYPLVVGLIGVLFQNKSAKKTFFPIYQMYSGFMFAGLSGLFLSIFIILGYFLRASVDDSTYLAICITSALWLTFNIFLTAWFFNATFLMLDEGKRDRLVVRFTIHELCEIDIRRRLRNLLMQNSVHNKMLANPDEKVLKVSAYKFDDDKYKEVVILSEDKIYVTNVYFSVINCVIRYYLLKNWLFSKKWVRRPLKKDTIKPEIVIQPVWTKASQSGLVVARYAGFEIGWLSKILIKASFVTKKIEEDSDKSLTSMISGFTGSANDSIREKNVSEFKLALEDVVKWHVEIASALSFLNDRGEEDNWFLLPTSSFFSRSYLDEILTEYYRLSKAAVEIIPESIEFFDKVIYLHKSIFSRRDNLVEREGFSLIQGSYFTWSLLMEWRSYSSSSSDMRLANKYEDVLFDFVGSWESWLDNIMSRKDRIKDLPNSLPLFIAHLEFTSHTAITALRYDNVEAAGWGIDMLNNWIEKISIRGAGHIQDKYRWRSELLTHDFLLKSTDDQIWLTILNGSEFNIKSAFNIAISNAAFDLRVITACYILLKPDLNDNEQVRHYVRALLSGAQIHPTGRVVGKKVKSVSKASDILGAYIRHRDYGSYGEGSYGSWISNVLDSFGRVNEKRRVSGRIYSGWGRNEPHSMISAYVEIAILFSKNPWALERKWYDIIFSNVFSYQDKKLLVNELQEWVSFSDEMEETFLISKAEFRRNRDNFKDSIYKIINDINQQQNEIISSAEIDDTLLTRLGLACSKVVSAGSQQLVFPIGLFKSINYDANLKKENSFKVNVQGFLKENIVKNVDNNRDIFEGGWLIDLIKDSVRVNILKRVFWNEITDFKTYSNVENNIIDICELGKTISEPVLFSGNLELCYLLNEARYNKDLAGRFDISFMDGCGGDYICHVGGVIVFGAHLSDVNFSLLTAKSLFENIEFGQVSDKQFVKVEYESSDENTGIISLRYWMKVSLAGGLPCIKMETLSNDER